MTRSAPKSLAWLLAGLLCLLGSMPTLGADDADEDEPVAEQAAPLDPKTGKPLIPNKRCLKCHGDEDEKTSERDDGTEVDIYVEPEKFENSVHGKQLCVGCHNTVTKAKHKEPPGISVSCVTCHQEAWDEHKDSKDPKYERLGVVVKQIDSFMNSVHARPSKQDQSRTNATCYDCHDAHNIGTIGSEQRAEHRLKNPEVCGRCHEKQLEAYRDSDHGKAVLEKGDSKSAVCSDCHTTHNIDSTKSDATMLAITDNCGGCHKDAQKSYRSSYHGQVNKLGYAHSAKCFDCHGGHTVKGVDDPASSIHLNNRLETCQKCHKDAPEGFLGFHPHGNANDYDKYPWIWLTAKFMNLLILGVFAFFWTHVLFWFYREYKDRKAGKSYAHPVPGVDTVYFRRFSATWRWVHFFFAVSTMVLVLSGSSLLFAHTDWAPVVMSLLGGPKIEAIIHRTAATIWLSVFAVHLFIVTLNIYRNRKTFRWFGPNSMIPNWQDLWDVIAMFKWFFGRAERPTFDRFTYWQKFDYWAPFWGAAVIGFSGLMLYFPTKTAIFLPGWVFNIATIIHAEEALLATMFLFTVHFFNSHFRPDRFPMSTIMFTGAVPLEEFKFEHRKEYERLKASGELEKYLIKAPSARAEKWSRFLAVVLILAGLGLLSLVLIGYTTLPH